MLTVEPHPLLRLGALDATFPRPLGELASPAWLTALLADGGDTPLARSEPLRAAVRDLLRHGGYKPTGRGKPASEYLVRAAGESLASINPAVDVCNAVSLHSGLPISVVDLDRAAPPLGVRVVEADERYVFNAARQEIRVRGLLCLCDASGPCANAVKDSQRTKTSPSTRRTLSLIWGTEPHAVALDAALEWYRTLLQRLDAVVRDAVVPPSAAPVATSWSG